MFVYETVSLAEALKLSVFEFFSSIKFIYWKNYSYLFNYGLSK